MKEHPNQEINKLIEGCKRNDRKSQKATYRFFYGFCLKICLRYAPNKEEALEVVNDGFVKVFTKIDQYEPSQAFRSWVSRIMINTAIDHYRRNKTKPLEADIDHCHDIHLPEETLSHLGYKDLLQLVQKLPPGYRAVFNLHAMDGYTHEEIAEMLTITVGTSKSNLFKAREKLKEMIVAINEPKKKAQVV